MVEANVNSPGTSSENDLSATLPPSFNLIVDRAKDLPAFQPLAHRAIVALGNPRATLGGLVQIISADLALAARLLKVANSVTYRQQGEIKSIDQAVMTVGAKNLRGILLAATIHRQSQAISPEHRSIWEHSLVVALACRETARIISKKIHAEELFLLGLLHDFGKLVVLQELPHRYRELSSTPVASNRSITREEQMLSFSHDIIGSVIASRWSLPEQLHLAIRYHHQSDFSAIPQQLAQKVAVLKFANALAHHLGFNCLNFYSDTDSGTGDELSAASQYLNLTRSYTDTILRRVEGSFIKSRTALISA